MPTIYRVKNIFGPTIQGEGPHQGAPCVFLRLSGCNAWDGRPETRADSACPYCDTDFRGGDSLSADNIRTRLAALLGEIPATNRPAFGLVISGGEPLLQVDQALLECLSPDFAWIDIETNGSRPCPPRPANVLVICSPKAIAGERLRVTPDAWKILIPAQEHFLPQALASGKPIWLQPLCPDHGPSGPLYERHVQRCLDLAFTHGCLISVQLHKYLGVE